MAETFNQQMFDAMVRHQVGLLQYSAGVRNKVWKLLDATEADVRQQIMERLRLDIGKPLTPARLQRVQKLLASLRETRMGAWKGVKETWFEDMKALAVSETDFMATTMAGIYPVDLSLTLPDTAKLRALVTQNPFNGATLSQWAAGEAKGDIDRIHQQIKIGLAQNETLPQLARRVVGTQAMNGADGATALTRRNAEAITRTATIGIASASKREFALANADLMSGELFVGTLDSKTTPVCRANDGKIYPVGEGPDPPLHWNCRSQRVPIVDGEVIGERPMRNFTEKQLLREFADKKGFKAPATRKGLPRGTKGEFDAFARKRMRELTGIAPAKLSYQEWLKGQPAQFQDDILGPSRGKLFREGGLTLDKFVSPTGKTLTLEELKVNDASALRAAKVVPPTAPGTVAGVAPPTNALEAAVQADTAAAQAAQQAATQAAELAAAKAAQEAAQVAAAAAANAAAQQAAQAAQQAAAAAQAVVDATTAKAAKKAAAQAKAAAKKAAAAGTAASEAVGDVDYTEWLKSLSAEETKAIKGWTEAGYTSMRAAQLGTLEGAGAFVKSAKRAAQVMTEALERAPKRAVTVFRGFGMPRKEFDKLRKGGGWKLSANSSFSESRKTALWYADLSESDDDFVRMVVEARMKRGGPNLAKIGMSKHLKEQEVVGLIGQKFRMISLTERGGTWHLVVEEI